MPIFKKNSQEKSNKKFSPTSFPKASLLQTEAIIKISKEGGADFGTGNANERIRYFIKLGLLPHAVRKTPTQTENLKPALPAGRSSTRTSSKNISQFSILNSQFSKTPVGHLPYWCVERLIKITNLNKKGLTFPQIAKKLKQEALVAQSPLAELPTPKPITADTLLPTKEVIKLAKKGGADLGSGDAGERIRYFVKLGLLTHAVRRTTKKSAGTVGHLPYSAVTRLIEITSLNKKGLTFPQIAEKFKNEAQIAQTAPIEQPPSVETSASKPAPVEETQQVVKVSLLGYPQSKDIEKTLKEHEQRLASIIDKKLNNQAQISVAYSAPEELPKFTFPKTVTRAAFVLIVFSLLSGTVFIGQKGYQRLSGSKTTKQVAQDFAASGQVLAASSANHRLYIDADSEFSGTTLFKENITAPNIIYSVRAGTGIAVSPGQNPTVSLDATAIVPSINDASGPITLKGSGSTSITNSGGIFTISSSSSGLTAEADTLATVTGRGATTATAVTFSGGATVGTSLTLSAFSSNGGILYTNGSGVTQQVTAGTAAQCLLGGTTPSFGSCATGGVASVDGLTGALTISNSSGLGTTITIDDATTAAKGIASFSSSYFSVTSGAVSIKTGGVSSTEILDATIAGGDLATGINISTTGTIATTGTGTITSAGTLTASNGFTLTTGALNLTATSGALTLSGLSASSISTGANALTITSSNFNTTSTGINATAIGATTASTGAFTTLSATPGSTNDITLTTDADSTIVITGLASATGTTSLCLDGTNNVITCASGGVGSGDITSVTAGAGLTGGGTSGDITLDIGAGTGITVNTNDVAVNESTAFAWTGLHSWTSTLTTTSVIQDINLTLGDDSDADVVVGINVDVTSATTGDADIILGLNLANITSVDTATVTETAIRVGEDWENIFELEGTTNDGVETYITATDPTTSDKTINIPNASGTFAVSGSGVIGVSVLGDITCSTCLTSSSGVTTLTGTANQVLVNGTSGVATSGAITVTTPQDIATTSSPTFANLTLTTGGALRTSTSDTNTALLQAYDVDGAAYTTFGTLTAGNTPTFNLATGVTIGSAYIYRAGGTDIPVTDGGTGASTFGGANTLLYTSAADTLTSLTNGSTGQCLTATTSSAPSWGSCAGTGVIGGSGTAGQIAFFNGTGTTITSETAGFGWDTTNKLLTITGSTSLSTGTVQTISDTSNSYSTGGLLNLSLTQSAATGTSVSGNIASISFNPTYSTGVTTPAISGNLLNIARSVTTNSSFASTLTVSGAVAAISDNCTQTTGTCTSSSTAHVLLLTQSYASAQGAVIKVSNAGAGSGIYLDMTNATGSDGILLNVPTALTDAIDASDAEITNALNVGANTITGTGYLLTSTASGLTINSTSADLALQTTTSGNITATVAATGLVNVLTGNLKVGNGTPEVTLNGEDAYIEGTLEVDGASQLDGAATFNTDVDFTLASAENFTLTVTTPTVDAVSAGLGTSSTDGVDGLALTFGVSAASGDLVHLIPSYTSTTTETFNVIEADAFTATQNGAAATGSVSGLKFGNLTQTETAGTITAYALNVGTGWDDVLNVGGTTVVDGDGTVIAGQITGVLHTTNTDSVSSNDISRGDILGIYGNSTDGSDGIDVNHTGDDITISFDATEIQTETWGAGSAITWTFDAGTTDPTLAFGDGTLTITPTASNTVIIQQPTASSGILDVNVATTTSGIRAVDSSFTFSGTGNNNSAFGNFTALTSSQALTGTTSQTFYGNYTTVTKSGDDNLTSGTINTFGVNILASNTGTTNATGTRNTYGGYFSASAEAIGTTSAYGIFAQTTGTPDVNYGIYINSSGGTANYALYAAGGKVNIQDLATASSAVYTDANKNLTSTAPTSGAIGYWNRGVTACGATATLCPTTANDIVSIANTTTTGADFAITNTGIYTGTGIFNLTANSATTGTVMNVSGNGLTTGTLLNITSTSTAGTASTSDYGIQITRSGANAGATHTAYGISSSVTNTGTTNTNYGIFSSVSGATNNYASYFTMTPTGSTSYGAYITGSQPASVSSATGTNAGYGLVVTGITGGNTTIGTTGTGGIGTGISLTLGAGGTANSATIADTGGAGGAFSVTAGAGAAAASASSDSLMTGGNGGAISLTTGTGGIAGILSVGTTTSAGGAGGAFSITTGAGGGAAINNTNIGGNGGAISLTTGNGGAVSTGSVLAPGNGGAITLTAGNAGSGGNANGGTLTLNSGTPSGSGTSAINIGTAAVANTTTIGNTTGATSLAFTSGTGSQTFTSSVATGTTTTSAFVFQDSTALTSGTGIYANFSGSLTGSKGIDLNVTSTMASGTAYGISNNWTSETGNSIGVKTVIGNYNNVSKTVGTDSENNSAQEYYGSYTVATFTGSGADPGNQNLRTYGGYFHATGDTIGNGSKTFGIVARAQGADINHGLYVLTLASATTANYGLYMNDFSGAALSKGINIGTMSSATSTGIQIGNLSGTTANTGMTIGTLSGSGATGTGITVGNISTTGANNYGLILGTLTGGTSGNYQISTGSQTAIASATNAQLNLGTITGTAASSNNYGINIGAINSTGTVNYGIYLGAVSGATNNYGLYVNQGNSVFNGSQDGSLASFATNANTLPAIRGLHSSVVANGYVYVIGGYNGTSYQTTVYYAKLNADGSTGAWSTNANSLPATRATHTSVVANGYVYVIGGLSGASFQSTVYYAKLNADGSTGAFSTNAKALPEIRGYHSSVVANGYVYAIGGINASATQSTVYYAKLNADGSTGAWSTNANTLPAIRDQHSSVVANGYVYVIGGENGTTNQSTVYYAQLNADGSTGAFSTNANALPAIRGGHSSVVANGYVYVIGGNDGSANQSTVYYAKLNADGSTGAFSTNTNTLPGIRGLHSSVVANGYVYTIGGRDASAYQTTVYYASTARVSVAANLDLLGLTAGQLTGASSDFSLGSAGGSIFAGNIFSGGNLEVTGNTELWSGLSVNNTFNNTGSLKLTALDEAGSLSNIFLTDTSTNTSNGGTTSALNIAATINTTGAGSKTINGINVASPTVTACTTGACTFQGVNIGAISGAILGTGINIGAITSTGANNYGINIGAISGTGTTNYGIKIGAISGGTNRYPLHIDNTQTLNGILQASAYITGAINQGASVSYQDFFTDGTITVTADPGNVAFTNFSYRTAKTIQITSGVSNTAGQIGFSSQDTFKISGVDNGARTIAIGEGFRSSFLTNNSGSGTTALTLTNFKSFAHSAATIAASTTVSNLYGFYAENTAPTGTLTNQYGLYIANLTGGTNNYGIYLAGADTSIIYGTQTSSVTGNIGVNLNYTSTAPTAAIQYGMSSNFSNTTALNADTSPTFYGIYSNISKTGTDGTDTDNASDTTSIYGITGIASNTSATSGGDQHNVRTTIGGFFQGAGSIAGSDTTNAYGVYGTILAGTEADNNAAGYFFSAHPASNTTALTTTIGVRGFVQNRSDAAITSLYGTYFQALTGSVFNPPAGNGSSTEQDAAIFQNINNAATTGTVIEKMYGLRSINTNSGYGNITNFHGLNIELNTAAAATGTISTLKAINVDTSGLNAATTVTNSYGIFLGDMSVATTATGNYGIYVSNQTSPATSDYGIFLAGADTNIIYGTQSSATDLNKAVNIAYTNSATASVSMYGIHGTTTNSGAVGNSVTQNTYGAWFTNSKSVADTSSDGTTTQNHAAVYGGATYTDSSATGGDTSTRNIYGAYFTATGDTDGTGNAIGVFATAASGDNNYPFYAGVAFPTGNSERLCWDAAGDSAIYDCTGTPGDYAEAYGTTDTSTEAGDVVAIDSTKPAVEVTKNGDKGSKAWVIKTTQPYQNNIVGVISTQPNEVIGKDNFDDSDNPKPVTLSGRIPIKVTDENGPIAIGDLLTSSSTPGYAMKADPKKGSTIGKAEQNFTGPGTGKIIALFGNETRYDLQTAYQNINLESLSFSTTSGNTIIDTFGNITTSGNVVAGGTLTAAGGLFTVDASGNVQANSLNADSLNARLLNITGDATVDGNLTASAILTSNIQALTASDLNISLGDNAGSNSLRILDSMNHELFTINSLGNADFRGTVRADAFETHSTADLAEKFPSQDSSIEAGDIVAVDPNNKEGIIKSNQPNQSTILGVISTKPGLTLNAGEEGQTLSTEVNPKDLALAGRVPVKVNLENGPISAGDPITSSSTPGIGMKATQAGRVIGIALESYGFEKSETLNSKSETNFNDQNSQCNNVAIEQCSNVASIVVFVNPSWYTGTSLAANGSIIEGHTASGQALSQDNQLKDLALGNVTNADGTLSSEALAKEDALSKAEIEELVKSEVTRQVGELLASSQQLAPSSAGSAISSQQIAAPVPTPLSSEALAKEGQVAGINTNCTEPTNSIVQATSSTVIASEATQSTQIATSSLNSPRNDTCPEASTATAIAQGAQIASETEATLAKLTELLNTKYLILDTLSVTGPSNLAQTQVAGTFSQDGTFIIDYGRQLNVLGSTLFLQNDVFAGSDAGVLVDIGAGSVTIDKNGDIRTQGTITAQNIQTKEITIDTSDVNAKTVGSANIATGKQSITIFTTALKPNAKVLLTPTGPTGGKTLYVANKSDFEGFTVTLDGGITARNIQFDWLIVNTSLQSKL